MQKWTRNYILSIQVKDSQWIDISMPFTMSFRVVRNTFATANTAKITILNLSEDTRRKIYKDRYKFDLYKGIELRAGYGVQKELLPLIFKGNIKQAYSKKDKVDYITEIEAYDGGFAFQNGRTIRSFAAGTPDKQILKSLIEDLPAVSVGKIGTFKGSLPRGNAMQGVTADLIKNVSNSNFFIDNEKAYCMQEEECFRGNITEINSASGLLGSPQREETLLTFNMLFEPRLQVGQYVHLTSETEKLFNGSYKVIGLEHSGTISDATGGRCESKVSLFYGALPLRFI